MLFVFLAAKIKMLLKFIASRVVYRCTLGRVNTLIPNVFLNSVALRVLTLNFHKQGLLCEVKVVVTTWQTD